MIAGDGVKCFRLMKDKIWTMWPSLLDTYEILWERWAENSAAEGFSILNTEVSSLCSQNCLRRKNIAKPGFVLSTGELFIPASSEAASICCTKSRESNKKRNEPRQRVKDSVPKSLGRPREKQNLSLGHHRDLFLHTLLKLGPSAYRITVQLGGIHFGWDFSWQRRLSLSYDGNGWRQ